MKYLDKLLLKIKPVEIIKKSDLFDSKWYKEKYQIKSNPFNHYLNEGWLLNYNPSKSFSTNDYLINNPDIKDINPLLHYEVFGKYEGRRVFIPPLEDIDDVKFENFEMKLNEYYKTIESKDLVSFDIFDTLLIRPFIKPDDLFRYMEVKYECIGFYKARIEAEKEARKQLNKEVHINEIYDYIDDRYKDLLDKEIGEESLMCHRNKTIYPIYEYARKNNKRVIAISDMYLGKDIVSEILEREGYLLDEIYVSCDYNKTKGSGSLYDEVLKIENKNINDMVHFGDNYLSDYSSAREKKIEAYHTIKSLDLFLSNNSDGYVSYLKRHDDLATSIHLALVAEYMNDKHDDFFKALGYVFGANLVAGYLNYLCKKSEELNLDKLLFVSRDGYALIDVYKKYFYDKFYIPYDYAYLSRASIISGNVVNNLNDDLRKFLEVAKVALKGIDAYEDDNKNKEEYLHNKELIDDYSIKRSDNLNNHLLNISEGYNKLAVVDMVSGKFTSYKGAKYYLKDRINKGFFAGTFVEPENECLSYSSRILGMRDNLAVKFSEFLVTSYESPINGVDEDGKAIYEYAENEARINRYRDIIEGINEYLDIYLKYFEFDNNYLLDFDAWIDLSSSYLMHCDDEDLNRLEEVVDSENPVKKDSDKSFKQLVLEYRDKGY